MGLRLGKREVIGAGGFWEIVDSGQTEHMTRRRGKDENILFGSAAQTGQKKAKQRAVQAAVCEKKRRRG
jgi:hypothetical protein